MNKSSINPMFNKSLIIILGIIIIIGAFFRFYNYSQRFTQGMDQSRDVLVSRISVRTGEIPLLGSVSSAGFFFFGPLWYWFLMISAYIFPNVFLAPWISFTLLSVFFILLMFFIGKYLGGWQMGLLLALFTALAYSQIYFSSYLTHHIMVAFFTGLSILEVILIIKDEKRIFNYLLLGVFLGIAANMHWQALSQFLIIPSLILFKPKVLFKLPLIILGIFITFIPLLIFDLNKNFMNFNGVVYYFLKGSQRFYMPNRWLTYAFDFWPKFYAGVLGVNKLIGFFFLSIITILLVIQKAIKKLSLAYSVIACSLIFQVILLRYQPGVKFETYLLYLHPYLLILTAWMFNEIIKYKKILGLLYLLITLFLIIRNDFSLLLSHNNEDTVKNLANNLIVKYPNEKFEIMNYNGSGTAAVLSLPLSLYLDFQNKLSKNGRIIGICAEFCTGKFSIINRIKYGQNNFLVLNMSKKEYDRLDKLKWYAYYPEIFKRPALKSFKFVNNKFLFF